MENNIVRIPESDGRQRKTSSKTSSSLGRSDAFITWIGIYRKYGLYCLGIAIVLCLTSLITNPVSDPSFPWLTLPSWLRTSFQQPLIEHWPVTFTLGIWLWVFAFPALFLMGFNHYGKKSGRYRSDIWLVVLPVIAMIGWTAYCRFFWPKLQPQSWNAPAYTLVCWLYCSSYIPFWSNLAYLISSLGIAASLLSLLRSNKAPLILAIFGVLAFPLGIPALCEAHLRHNKKNSIP